MAASDKHARTEPPTAKRLKKARDKGQVARSPEISGWSALVLASFIVPLVISHARSAVIGVFGQSMHVAANPSVAGASATLNSALHGAFDVIVPTASAFMVLGVVLNVAQVGRSFSLQAAKPRFDRINPKAGVKRLFSVQSSFGLAKQFLKLVLLGGLAAQTMHTLLTAVPSTVPLGLAQTIGLGTSSLVALMRTVGLLGLAIGLGDYIFQRHHFMTSMKMTKQEVKDEHRQAEGDPAMKGELRKRQYAIARSKVIAAVRTADVIVANPTHFAVALQYQSGKSGAPKVVAKGSDALAGRIREEAGVHAIPVVEDPPLARYLYATCDIGQAIPTEIYVAVAKLLAFVYSLPPALRTLRTHYHPPSAVPVDPGAATAARGRASGRRRRMSIAA